MWLLPTNKQEAKPVNKYPDVPEKYDITHFPSSGLFYPMMDGKYLWTGYRDSGRMETTDSPYQAFSCKSVEECVKVIRRHMEWHAPVQLTDWRER